MVCCNDNNLIGTNNLPLLCVEWNENSNNIVNPTNSKEDEATTWHIHVLKRTSKRWLAVLLLYTYMSWKYDMLFPQQHCRYNKSSCWHMYCMCLIKNYWMDFWVQNIRKAVYCLRVYNFSEFHHTSSKHSPCERNWGTLTLVTCLAIILQMNFLRLKRMYITSWMSVHG